MRIRLTFEVDDEDRRALGMGRKVPRREVIGAILGAWEAQLETAHYDHQLSLAAARMRNEWAADVQEER